MRQRAQQVIE